MKRVIIVGGGYAGANLARALDKVAEVCVVEARDHFVHNVAAIRSVVDPSLLGQIVIPYDRLLRRGRVRQGLVANAFDGGVTLANGETIEGDVVIVATGSSYARPFKPAWHFAQAFADSVKDAHAGLLETERVDFQRRKIGGGRLQRPSQRRWMSMIRRTARIVWPRNQTWRKNTKRLTRLHRMK